MRHDRRQAGWNLDPLLEDNGKSVFGLASFIADGMVTCCKVNVKSIGLGDWVSQRPLRSKTGPGICPHFSSGRDPSDRRQAPRAGRLTMGCRVYRAGSRPVRAHGEFTRSPAA